MCMRGLKMVLCAKIISKKEMKGKKSRVIIITFVTINGSQIDHKCELNPKYIKM